MRKIKDVLRLKLDAKMSHQQIAAALGISRGVVTKYVGLAATAGLDWATVCSVDEAALERRLLVAPERPREHVQPDYGRLHQELRRKGMTLMLLWEEHRADHADRHTYGYTQFCENYRRFTRQLKRSMRQVHRAGEKLFIDYAGPTIGLTDGSRAHIFVAALGASSYTYACATPRETMADWIESTARALAFIGGVPQLIVPDIGGFFIHVQENYMASRKNNFTTKICDKLTGPAPEPTAKEIEYTDMATSVKLMVSKNRKTWYYRYTINGTKRVIRIGTLVHSYKNHAVFLNGAYAIDGLCCTNRLRAKSPLPQAELCHGHRRWSAESGEAIEDGGAHL